MKILIYISILILFLLTSCAGNDQVLEENCFRPIALNSILSDYEKTNKPLAKVKFDELLDPDWTQKDFQVLRLILEESNPNIYRYTDKSTMDSLFDSALCKLNDSIYYIDFVKHIAKVFNKMACGHSGWGHSNGFQSYRNDSMKFFPLDLISQNNRYFITRNNSYDSTIILGSEILSINSQTPSSINRTLRNHMNRDGSSIPNAETEISKYFRNAYSNFINNPQIFYLEIKDTSGKVKPLKIYAQSRESIDLMSKSKYGNNRETRKPLRFEMDPVFSIATYTINRFRNESIEQHGQNFNSFTDSVFQIINRNEIENLIIDLRGNGGGWTANGKKLFSFFIQDTIPYIRKVELSKLDSFSFAPLLLSNQGIEDTMIFQSNQYGLYEWSNYPNLIASPSIQNGFIGNTFILINEESKSCSSAFSSMMKSHTDAIFIGEENGASQCGSGGMVIIAALPYTGITIVSSTAKYYFNVSDANNSRGVMVDYPVENDIFSRLELKDQQIEFTYDLIKKRTITKRKMD